MHPTWTRPWQVQKEGVTMSPPLDNRCNQQSHGHPQDTNGASNIVSAVFELLNPLLESLKNDLNTILHVVKKGRVDNLCYVGEERTWTSPDHIDVRVPQFPPGWRHAIETGAGPSSFCLAEGQRPRHAGNSSWQTVTKGLRHQRANANNSDNIETSNRFSSLEFNNYKNASNEKFKLNQKSGDIFKQQNVSVVHCVAADLAMRKGFALQIRERFGYISHLRNQNKTVGEIAILPIEKNDYVFNLITKLNSSDLPLIDNIEKCIQELRKDCDFRGVKHIVMPKIATGCDQVSWRVIKELIIKHFNSSDITIDVYTLPTNIGKSQCNKSMSPLPSPTKKKNNSDSKAVTPINIKTKSPSNITPKLTPSKSTTTPIQKKSGDAQTSDKSKSILICGQSTPKNCNFQLEQETKLRNSRIQMNAQQLEVITIDQNKASTTKANINPLSPPSDIYSEIKLLAQNVICNIQDIPLPHDSSFDSTLNLSQCSNDSSTPDKNKSDLFLTPRGKSVNT